MFRPYRPLDKDDEDRKGWLTLKAGAGGKLFSPYLLPTSTLRSVLCSVYQKGGGREHLQEVNGSFRFAPYWTLFAEDEVGILTCQSILADTSWLLNEKLGDMLISNQNKLQLKREKKVVAALQVIPTKSPTASNEIKASPSIDAPPKKQKIEDEKSSNGSKGSKQAGLSDGGKAVAEFLFSGKSSWVGPDVDEKIAQSVFIWGLRSAAIVEFFKYLVKELASLLEMKTNMLKLTDKLREDEAKMKTSLDRVQVLEEGEGRDGYSE
ncbi:hypothetical protein SESBI_30191 [Sesbania bispinosa]|nr:hypothetical protein SESBI_30191 [Sesbania bispinosa]